MEEKIKELSKKIVDYSLKIKENDRVLITTMTSQPNPLVKALIRDITNKKGLPFVRYNDPEIGTLMSELTNEKRIETLKKLGQNDIDNYDVFINIRYTTNDYENSLVNPEITKKTGEALVDINDIRINERRWVLLNYPSKLDAYKASMTTDKYMDYALDVMNVDYSDLYERIKPLKELMEKTDNVRIVSPGTDITFSIKDMPAIPCCGTCNLPDGEIYTAPIKDSVNGTITYNTKSPYSGTVFSNVKLTFKDGKIVECSADNNQEKLESIFDTDAGSRYIGEFAFGLNPLVLNPMGDILFDEKIIGSIHFTPGMAYKDAFNGNVSSVHWDLVLIQRSDYGGGEIYFDHTLIRKDGLFVLDELKHLNYNLKN